MEWLSKAGDLLDKLDKTAAEKLENVGFESVTPPDEEDLLNILNGDEDEEAGLAAVEAKTKGGKVSPEEALKRFVAMLVDEG